LLILSGQRFSELSTAITLGIRRDIAEKFGSLDARRWLPASLVLLILVVAVFLRLRHIDTTGIWGDQSFTLNTAMRWVNGGDFPLAANKSSVGVMNPPMIEYLYAFALRLWPDVLSVALLTMISSIAAMVFTAYVTYKIAGWQAAIWATLFFAINPWSVLYGQLIWNQTMIPFFASLTLAALLLYFAVEQKGIYLVLAFVGAAGLTQVHPGSVMQLISIGLVLVVFWRKLRPLPLLAGVLAFILLYTPFLIYELGVGWTDISAVLSFAGQEATISPAAAMVSLDLLHSQGLTQSMPGLRFFDLLATIIFGLALLYVLVTSYRAFRRRSVSIQARSRSTAVFILLVWLVMPVLFYLRTSAYLQIYYLMGQWPAPFILIGLALSGAQKDLLGLARDRLPRVTLWLIFTVPIVALLAWQLAANLHIQNARLDAQGGDAQIRHVRQAIQQAGALADSRPGCSLVVVSTGFQVEISGLSLLHEFTSIENLLLADGELALPLPAPCALYLDADPDSRASRWLNQTATPVPQADLRVNNETWRFYELPTSDMEELLQRMDQSDGSIAWTNGLVLLDYERGELEPGSFLPLTLLWQVAGDPPNHNYHFGTYLLAEENQVVSQADGPGFDSIQWRSGDHFITWFDIPGIEQLQNGSYSLAVAMYTWPDLARVDLVAGDNTAFLEQIEVER